VSPLAPTLFLLLAASLSCMKKKPTPPPPDAIDIHSYAQPHLVTTRHVELDLTVDFVSKILTGWAELTLIRLDGSAPLVADTRGLAIHRVETSEGEKGQRLPAKFTLGTPHRILGASLTVDLPPRADRVRIHYSTSPDANALQWLDPAQTAGKKRPFLFTQSQAINARSWIPLQDSPRIRTTYRARIRTPKDLIALMSARRDFRLGNPKEEPNGDYTFRMPHRIPSYLIALAVGDPAYHHYGHRTGLWAEPPEVERAAREFDDTERMIQAAEKLYGPYAWLKYEILVLPPSFPFGGMENPLLTFATPTVVAGDKSLVSLVAHELAHSWSGNLVTNATWRDFWLNEGVTVYVERRIQEAVFGEPRARMEAVLGLRELQDEMKNLPPADQLLHIDLAGRDPDDAVTAVPYEKGALFLLALEQAFGRERFDEFLLRYFNTFRFRSITTAEFRAFLETHLLNKDPAAAAKVPVEEWITRPGIPANAPQPVSEMFGAVEQAARTWERSVPDTKTWNTQQWLHFLQALPEDLGSGRMGRLDRAFRFTQSQNSEILCLWLTMAARNSYAPAYPRIELFLTSVGRRKFLKPLYEELAKTPHGRARAERIYSKARQGYHPISQTSIDEILNRK
jgi:aminopeptidase N